MILFQFQCNTFPQVYFPSIVICNKNSLRKSFGYALLKDPALGDIALDDLLATIDKVFIKGESANSSGKMEDIKARLLSSAVLDQIYSEFVEHMQNKRPEGTLSNAPLMRYHDLEDANASTVRHLKSAFVVEMAAQFRSGEMIAEVDFSGFGTYLEYGFSTDVSESCIWMTPMVKRPKGYTNSVEFRCGKSSLPIQLLKAFCSRIQRHLPVGGQRRKQRAHGLPRCRGF